MKRISPPMKTPNSQIGDEEITGGELKQFLEQRQQGNQNAGIVNGETPLPAYDMLTQMNSNIALSQQVAVREQTQNAIAAKQVELQQLQQANSEIKMLSPADPNYDQDANNSAVYNQNLNNQNIARLQNELYGLSNQEAQLGTQITPQLARQAAQVLSPLFGNDYPKLKSGATAIEGINEIKEAILRDYGDHLRPQIQDIFDPCVLAVFADAALQRKTPREGGGKTRRRKESGRKNCYRCADQTESRTGITGRR